MFVTIIKSLKMRPLIMLCMLVVILQHQKQIYFAYAWRLGNAVTQLYQIPDVTL